MNTIRSHRPSPQPTSNSVTIICVIKLDLKASTLQICLRERPQNIHNVKKGRKKLELKDIKWESWNCMKKDEKAITSNSGSGRKWALTPSASKCEHQSLNVIYWGGIICVRFTLLHKHSLRTNYMHVLYQERTKKCPPHTHPHTQRQFQACSSHFSSSLGFILWLLLELLSFFFFFFFLKLVTSTWTR